ncbi:hypothetical protein BV22DRAFT_1135570 [Leucogyrophana mollusca]|uniref:Uncharacterized protein n=1 Tax=Leucogyrophana mollusca TaxID=85980 RepID=A0ACB8AWA0_9AGAM|nr:hypothetical protein BV22DRAFT_1135570 [Leucogyrophana mollusca]
MRDKPVSLLDIIRADIPHPEFAFLSACHTAVGDAKTPDEVIHLAAGMQFAGFKSVIGTMWAVDDEIAHHMVSAFYKNMFEHGMDYTKAAASLNIAMRTVDKKQHRIQYREARSYAHGEPVEEAQDVALVDIVPAALALLLQHEGTGVRACFEGACGLGGVGEVVGKVVSSSSSSAHIPIHVACTSSTPGPFPPLSAPPFPPKNCSSTPGFVSTSWTFFLPARCSGIEGHLIARDRSSAVGRGGREVGGDVARAEVNRGYLDG